MRAVAVIGMNFGDEGKGHVVNFLSNESTLNIRFNGGAQAAHAVFLSDGRNHIFKQFGSGTLRGARTLFASHMIINPLFFAGEWATLAGKVGLREVFVDPRCRITTIWDMLINAFSSYYRKRTDTTGIGINETVERSRYRQLRLAMRDLVEKSAADLVSILAVIREEYVPWRLGELGLPYDSFQKYLAKTVQDVSKVEEFYLAVVRKLVKCVWVWPEDNLVDRYLAKEGGRQLVFEGAQGFRLDQNRKELMPYLTRSNTGLQNVFDCLRMVATPLELDVYLVTRAYLTRHGDGPLWNEVDKPYTRVEEPTNPENPYQGAMRYGFLNKTWYNTALEEMKKYVCAHAPRCVGSVRVRTAFTCLDHVGEEGLLYSMDGDNKLIAGSVKDFAHVSIISKGNKETDCAFRKEL